MRPERTRQWRAGLTLTLKTIILTTKAQPPDHITTLAGHTIVVKDSLEHINGWAACFQQLAVGMLLRTLHIMCRLPRAFHSKKKGYCLDRNVSINLTLKLEATVTPIAWFAAGHRSIRQRDLHILDVDFRRLVRSVVGPSSGVCWPSPWHDILHVWNARAQQILESTHQNRNHGGRLRSVIIGNWRATLRTFHPMEWQPHAKKVGRRTNTSGTKIHEFARAKRWGNWQNVATRYPALWEQSMFEFVCGRNPCLSLFNFRYANSR